MTQHEREVMQMAFEALESSRVFVTSREKIKHPEGTEWYDERIEAIRARLAQNNFNPDWNAMAVMVEEQQHMAKRIEELETRLAQPEQKPVGKFAKFNDGIWKEVTDGSAGQPLYTAPLQRKPLTDKWVPVTQSLLNEQHPWLYQSMWIAMKGEVVVQGYYEWRQGRNPDRFITDLGDEWAFNADFVMPITKPTPPAIEAKLKEKNT